MKNDGFDRRSFLKGSVAGGVAAALPGPAQAQTVPPQQDAAAAPPLPAGYAFRNPAEALFIEAPGLCSPSRMVVSKMIKLSVAMVPFLMNGLIPFRLGIGRTGETRIVGRGI